LQQSENSGDGSGKSLSLWSRWKERAKEAAMSRTLPSYIKEFATEEFRGESMRWVGQPDPGRVAMASMLLWGFALPWTAFSVHWVWGASQSKDPIFPLFGLPFVLIGIGMLLSPLWNFFKARRTLYVLTPKRLTVLEYFPKPKVRSAFPGQIVALERVQHRDGSGNLKIIFGWVKDSEGARTEKNETLYGVPNVREVEKLIRELMERTTDASLARRSS
jgi:hypothetical protein